MDSSIKKISVPDALFLEMLFKSASSVEKKSISSNLLNSSAVVLRENQIPLTRADWQNILQLFESSPRQREKTGDIVAHDLTGVSRWVVSHPKPTVCNPWGEKLLHILAAPRMIKLYNEILGEGDAPLYVRRLQGNTMTDGDFNPTHRDSDDDPDYLLAVVLYLSDPNDYTGGELIVAGCEAAIKPEQYSLIGVKADTLHSVAAFSALPGKQRRSIVLILGRHLDNNRRFAENA